MKILFIDTNVFMQCKDLSQLAWAELFKGDEELLLLIPSVVREEIDKHKQEGNTRRGKRAKKASSFIRQIILADQTSLVIRDINPLVRISFPMPSGHPCSLPDLDLSRPDNRLIAEILSYKSDFPESDVAFLTHDTNPLLTAKRCGISYYVIPDDWLLPPEPDSRDKKISELESRLKELEHNYPVIEVSVQDIAKNKIERFSAETVKYKALTDDEINQLLEQIKKRYPMTTDFGQDSIPNPLDQALLSQFQLMNKMMGISHVFAPPDAAEVEEYQNELYPAWVESVRKYLLSLPIELEKSGEPLFLSIILFNNGSVPAENTVVEFSAMGDFFFAKAPEDEAEKEKKNRSVFPVPPKAPQGKWVTRSISSLDSIYFDKTKFLDATKIFHQPPYWFDPSERISPIVSSLLKPLPKRDRNKFYWKSGRSDPTSKKWVAECEEFRHKIEEEAFEMILVVSQSEHSRVEGALKCSVYAKNLPKPVTLHVPVKIAQVQGDTLTATRKYLGSLLPY